MKKKPVSKALSAIDHIVVLMLENRSFDHMLGFLYPENGNVSSTGQAFEGLTGKESNPDSTAAAVPVFALSASDPNAYFVPGADPGEGYSATNSQLFSTITYRLQLHTRLGINRQRVFDRCRHNGQGYHWACFHRRCRPFCPASHAVLPCATTGIARRRRKTLPNRAFVNAGTSQGHMDDKTKSSRAQAFSVSCPITT
jgi:phospholipase C